MMPELMENSVVFGILAALLSRFIPVRGTPKRPVPFWGSVLIGIVAAYVGPPALDILQRLWRALPFLPVITEGMVFLGGFVFFVMHYMFEGKDKPRRVPVRASLATAVVVALVLPWVLFKTTGTYQQISYRANVDHCTSGMRGQVQPRDVTNTCDFTIVVGLCMPDERNPETCRQSVTLAPGAVARFDPGEARLSYNPGNRDGLTVVACRPPSRPSRALTQVGRSHEGVCLPG
ncbi:hypothetical protein [Pseudosulfitobacter sp. DSM 107133]|uniref:hypothetical protein n=1 Tax=Pseudosulfitobacter sp. DSM 107133 TaxID=2883100 RepID=UPI00196468EF|nr:hypothetical protein [Pseudosulfitobacter sp. DSM 107133]